MAARNKIAKTSGPFYMFETVNGITYHFEIEGIRDILIQINGQLESKKMPY